MKTNINRKRMASATLRIAGIGIVLGAVVLPIMLLAQQQPTLPGRVDLRSDMHNLENFRRGEQAKLRNKGTTTTADFRNVDERYLSRARAMEDKRTAALEKLKQNSGIEVKQGPGGTQPKQGRGLGGDIDTASMTAKDFDKLKKTAKDMGYKITPQGDSFTIEELNVTVHRQTASEAKMASRAGTSGRAAEIARGYGEETAYGMKGDNPHASVNDNLKKAAHTLDTPPGEMTTADMQKLGKMNSRNVSELGKLDKAAAQEYATLQKQSQMLKEGYSPEAAGIVRENATPQQRAQDIADYQARSKELSVKSVKASDQWAESKLAELKRTAAGEHEKLARLQEKGASEKTIENARKAVEKAKSDVIEFQETRVAAKEAAVRNPSNGKSATNIMAEAKGVNASGKSPSAVREELLAGERKGLSRALKEAPGGLKGAAGEEVAIGAEATGYGSKLMKGAMGIMVIYGIVTGITEGAKQAGEDAGKKDEFLITSLIKGAGYSVWHGLGFGAAAEIGKKAGLESAEQWKKDVESGKIDKNSRLEQVYAHLRGACWGVAEFTGLQAIKDAVVEGGGAVMDNYGVYMAQKTQKAQDKALAEKKTEKEKSKEANTKPSTAVSDQMSALGRLKDTIMSGFQSLRDKVGRYQTLLAKKKEKEEKRKRLEAAIEQAKKKALAQKKKGKAAGPATYARPTLQPGTHEEVSGWARDKNGMTRLTYIKDANGNILGGYTTTFDSKGNLIGREDFTNTPDTGDADAKAVKDVDDKFLRGVEEAQEKMAKENREILMKNIPTVSEESSRSILSSGRPSGQPAGRNNTGARRGGAGGAGTKGSE